MDFYHSPKWRRLRLAILQRDGWRCQMAAARGKSEPAVTVHHIFPRSEFPQYQWDEWNLISLSLSAHNMMHIRDTDKLTERGELLRRQVAQEQGIRDKETTTLVIGMPGAGKTDYVRQNMTGGVVYDLDYIAGALRLKSPKSESFKPARWIANSLLHGFTEAAHRYTREVWVIRTAPTADELEDINPTNIVVIYDGYGNQQLTDDRRAVLARRIRETIRWAKANGKEVKEISHDHQPQPQEV